MEKYVVEKKIGAGAQAVAYLAHHAANPKERVVLKRIPIEKMSNVEMSIVMKLKHKHVINCREAFTHDDHLYLVFDHAAGGDLEAYLARLVKEGGKPLPPDDVARLFAQLAMALQFCHENRTLHRDIKTGNVFLSADRKSAFIGDFGVAKVLHSDQSVTNTLVGSPICLSPEVVCGEKYGYPSDVWALGCVLYEMLTLKRPFPNANFAALVTKISAGEYDPLPKSLPAYLQEIVAGLLTVETEKRWSLAEVIAHLPSEATAGIEDATGREGTPQVRGDLPDWVRWKRREIDDVMRALANIKVTGAPPLSYTPTPPATDAEDDSPVRTRTPDQPQMNANRAKRMLPSPQALAKQPDRAKPGLRPSRAEQQAMLEKQAALEAAQLAAQQVKQAKAEQQAKDDAAARMKEQREATRAQQQAELRRRMAEGRNAKGGHANSDPVVAAPAVDPPRNNRRPEPAVVQQQQAPLAGPQQGRRAFQDPPPAPPPEVAPQPAPRGRSNSEPSVAKPSPHSAPAQRQQSPPQPAPQPKPAAAGNKPAAAGKEKPPRPSVRDAIREQRAKQAATGGANTGGDFDVDIKLPGNLQHLLHQ